jgi:hypothetical protein
MTRVLLLAGAIGAAACTGGELEALAAPEAPLEVVATGGRSFARIVPVPDDGSAAGWERITPVIGGWVLRAWTPVDATRPFTVVSPDGICIGKTIASLDLAREIGVRHGRTAETGEVWAAVEIAGCPSFEGDRRLGLDGRVPQASWESPPAGIVYETEAEEAEVRTVGLLRAAARDYRIVETREGALQVLPLEGGAP